MQWGGCERGRVSSAALKRAVRTSRAFEDAFQGHLGHRTVRIGHLVMERLAGLGLPEAALASAASSVAKAFGKAEGTATETRQLSFFSDAEIAAAAALAERVARTGTEPTAKDLEDVLSPCTSAVDIALFGRMFADRGEIRMTAAAEVAHPFTVDRAALESDYYVAKDDHKPAEEDVGAGFIGEQFFVCGLFYGYARIDLGQLRRNLAGDWNLSVRAAKAFAEGVLKVSPSGKKASFGTNAHASWAMVERGAAAPRSLAAAFLKPVNGGDHLAEAISRAESLAEAMDTAYGEKWLRKSMDVAHHDPRTDPRWWPERTESGPRIGLTAASGGRHLVSPG